MTLRIQSMLWPTAREVRWASEIFCRSSCRLKLSASARKFSYREGEAAKQFVSPHSLRLVDSCLQPCRISTNKACGVAWHIPLIPHLPGCGFPHTPSRWEPVHPCNPALDTDKKDSCSTELREILVEVAPRVIGTSCTRLEAPAFRGWHPAPVSESSRRMISRCRSSGICRQVSGGRFPAA